MKRKGLIIFLCSVAAACLVCAGAAFARASSEGGRAEERNPQPVISQGASDTSKKLDDILAGIRELKSDLSDIKKELNTVKIRVTQSQ